MQRCPCCNARLGNVLSCSRCGADLSRAQRCEELANAWLSVSLQSLEAGHADVAVAAVKRSLSFKQTQVARVFCDFLVQHQYQALFEHLAQKQWQSARQTIERLRLLQGDSETLNRFAALIVHLSTHPSDNSLSN